MESLRVVSIPCENLHIPYIQQAATKHKIKQRNKVWNRYMSVERSHTRYCETKDPIVVSWWTCSVYTSARYGLGRTKKFLAEVYIEHALRMLIHAHRLFHSYHKWSKKYCWQFSKSKQVRITGLLHNRATYSGMKTELLLYFYRLNTDTTDSLM